ncbi:hypothetical protein NXS19_012134 [Fusarium pseudograminearum]|nr:hypothetical protein NXS19_012134 [Fusarium pseudograminearum]
MLLPRVPLPITKNVLPAYSATGHPKSSTSLADVSSLPAPTGSAGNSIPGTPRRGESDFEEDLERASTLMQLYDIRSKIKQQDNSSLLKAREKVNAIAARQQAQQAAERNMKAADELRRQRYSFPRAGL